MRKEGSKFAAFLAAFILVAIAGISIVNGETLDESQPDITQAYSFLPGEAKAQTFRVDDGKWLYRVDFYYDPGDCGILYAWIDTDFNGSNGNLTYHVFDTTSWAAGWHTWDIRATSGDIQLTPGIAYVLILMPGVFSTNPAWYGSTTDTYPNGRAYYINDTGEHPLDTVDYAFYIYTDVDPVAEFNYTIENLTVYVDASPSYTPDGDPIVSYEWDWDNDGTYDATGITASHTYSIEGNYTIKLRVTDEDSHSDIVTHSVYVTSSVTNQPPIANFTWQPVDASVNETIYFYDNSTDPDGTITSWQWDFGDGNTSTQQNPTHVYTSPGTYNVTLRVTDDNGAVGMITKSITIAAGGGGTPRNLFKLPFSWFAMFLMVFIGILGVATTGFFMKPESIDALGYAPAVGTLLITIFIIAAILMYHAAVAWYWLIADMALIIIILYITIKAVIVKKGEKYVRRLF